MKDDAEAGEIVEHYKNCQDVCKRELEELIEYWHGQLSHFQIRTPSPEFNTMINTWNAYNCFMTFIWSRAASFTYCGLRQWIWISRYSSGYSGSDSSGTGDGGGKNPIHAFSTGG